MTKEDAFNAALAACSSEQERSALITQTLNTLYGEAGAKYQEINADLIASRQAQSDFNAKMAEAGNAVRPLQTGLLQIATALLTQAMPYVQQFGDWFTANLPTIQQTVQTVISQIGATIQTLQPIIQPVLDLLMTVFSWLISNLPTIAPIVLGVVTAFMGLQGLISIITGLINAFNMFKTGITLVTTAFNLLKVAFMANPFGIIVTAIMAVITILMTLWTTNEDFRNAVMTAWNAISSAAMTIFNAIASFLGGIWNTITSTIGGAIDTVKNIIMTGFTAYQNYISNALNLIWSVISTIWNTISGFIGGIIDTIKSIIANGFALYKQYIESAMNLIKGVIGKVWNTIKDTVGNVINTIKDTISNGFNAAKDTVSNIFNTIKSTISNILNGAADIVRGAIDKIKGFFNFSWSLPKIKLPHFRISGSFSLNPPSIPSFGVDWYAKGGIFDTPTLFNTPNGLKGVGEKGAEAVTPISVLRDYVREEVEAANGELTYTLERLYNLLVEFLPMIADGQNKQLVLDSGALVGELIDPIDKGLGDKSRKRDRGQ